MLSATNVPASIISLYNLSTTVVINFVDPDVIFLILDIVCNLSPGFILSGLYPRKNSLLNFNPEFFSIVGTQISSRHPG